MLATDLKMGDIIFFCDTYGMAEHTSMYVAEREGIHYIIHATTKPHRGLMITYLKEADENCNYKVVRPINEELAVEAIAILLTWVEQKVPYANEIKINTLMNYLDDHQGYQVEHAGEVQENYAKSSYITNYGHYIKMANALPSTPIEGGIMQGLGCAESVVSAFNIALLLRHAIYNKTASLNDLKFTLPEEEPLEELILRLNNPLPLDAVVTGSEGLFNHCIKDGSNWLFLGLLEDYTPAKPTEQNKKDWREFIENYRSYSIDTQADCMQELQLMVPSFSPRERSTCTESPLLFLDDLELNDLRRRTSSLGSPYQYLGLLSPGKKQRSNSESFNSSSSFENNPSQFFASADPGVVTSATKVTAQLHIPVASKIPLFETDQNCSTNSP